MHLSIRYVFSVVYWWCVIGKPIILSLVRSEIGQVTLFRAWHDPNSVPSHIVHAYKQVLKLKNWNESLIQMSRTKPYSKMDEYHKSLSEIQCPVWLLHGDDDKLVTFRESVLLAQRYKYGFGPIKLRNCGHIPHQEIPKEFVEIIVDIVCRKLIEFERRDVNLLCNAEEEKVVENGDVANILNKGKEKFKQMMRNIHIMPNKHKKGNEDGLIQNSPQKQEVIKVNTTQSQLKATESSALLPD